MSEKMKLWILLIQLFFVFPFLALFIFAWPSCDDYFMQYLINTSGKNIGEVTISLYFDWFGRYSTMLFTTFSHVLVNNMWLYRFFLLIMFLLLFFSQFFFWKSILKEKTNVTIALIIALSYFILFIEIIPGVADSFYWFSGSVVYTAPLVLLFLFMGIKARNSEKHKGSNIILLAILAFFIIGFNEIAAVLLLIIGVYPIVERGPKYLKTADFLFLIIIIIGISILLLSPGNFKRLALFPDFGSLWLALEISLVSLTKFNGIHIQSLTVWLIILILFPNLTPDYFISKTHKYFKLHPFKVFLLGQTMFFVLFFIPAISMGISPPLRVYNFLSPFWLMWIFWFAVTSKMFLASRQIILFSKFSGAGKAFIALIIIVSMAGNFYKIPGESLVFRGNVSQAYFDLFYRAQSYDHFMIERKKLILEEKSKGNLELEVPALQDPPKTILFIDITPDPNHWINLLYANHYGLNSIRNIDKSNSESID